MGLGSVLERKAISWAYDTVASVLKFRLEILLQKAVPNQFLAIIRRRRSVK